MTLRCPSCTSDYCPIATDGPIDARIYCYGERPGQQEEYAARFDLKRGVERTRRCFIGQAGDEFNQNYLPLAGLTRDHIRVGNVVMCGQPNNKAPSKPDIQACASHHITQELQEGEPEIVVLMGASACSLLPDIDLEAEHGIPRYGSLFGWEGVVVPMYHPALGMHKTEMMRDMMSDWKAFGLWLETGEWQWVQERYTYRDYRLCRTPDEVNAYFRHYAPFVRKGWAGVDTESHGDREFSIQTSICPGTGIMVLEEDPAAIQMLSRCLHSFELIYHYAPADHPRMQRLGIGHRYRDTHIEAYNLALAQGLKALSVRLLGRRRKSWEELVGGASKRLLEKWLIDAYCEAEQNWTILEARVSEKTGKPVKPKRIVHEAEKTSKHVLRYTQSNPEYKSWEKLIEFGVSFWQAQMEERIGIMPIKGIANVPLPEAVDYGCSDADDTLTIELLFDEMRMDVVRTINVQDCDKDVLCLPLD